MHLPGRRPSSTVRTGALLVVSALGGLSLVACGDAPTRSSEKFCGELTAHQTEIHTPPESADAIPAFITLFSKMGEVAPLAVQKDWEAIYVSLKTANTVDVDDPASMQTVADSAYETQRSAENVVVWARANCGLELGPIGVVQGGADVATTTVPSTPAPG